VVWLNGASFELSCDKKLIELSLTGFFEFYFYLNLMKLMDFMKFKIDLI
jgi:hypothetical protein